MSYGKFKPKNLGSVEVVVIHPDGRTTSQGVSDDPRLIEKAQPPQRLVPHYTHTEFGSSNIDSPWRIAGLAIAGLAVFISASLGIRSCQYQSFGPDNKNSIALASGGTVVVALPSGQDGVVFTKSAANAGNLMANFVVIGSKEAFLLLGNQVPNFMDQARTKHLQNPNSVNPKALEDAFAPFIIKQKDRSNIDFSPNPAMFTKEASR